MIYSHQSTGQVGTGKEKTTVLAVCIHIRVACISECVAKGLAYAFYQYSSTLYIFNTRGIPGYYSM